MRRSTPALLCTLIVSVLIVFSQGAAATSWTLHGGFKNETAYFVSGERRFDKIQNRLDLEPEAVFSNSWQFRGRFLGWYDAAMDIEDTNKTDLTAAIKDHYRSEFQTKEAFLYYQGAAADARIGWQQIVWGKTDGLRLLDIVNPIDMREFILDDFLDSRIGLFALRLNYYPATDTEQEIEVLVIPDARTVEAAPPGSRWALATPPPPPGLAVQSLPDDTPDWGDTEFGLAWRSNRAGWDVSLNYFNGWKDTPNVFREITPGIMQQQLRYLRMQTLGGSFANAFGPWVLRGEFAANRREPIDTTTGTTFDDSVVRKNTLNAALSTEYSHANWTIGPQFFIRRIQDWESRLIEKQTTGFASLRIATDYLNEKLKPEILLLTEWSEDGWLARPKVSYEHTDHLTTTVGADIFTGHHGFFGQFADNDRVYVEIYYRY
jgi:hypothetical protein